MRQTDIEQGSRRKRKEKKVKEWLREEDNDLKIHHLVPIQVNGTTTQTTTKKQLCLFPGCLPTV